MIIGLLADERGAFLGSGEPLDGWAHLHAVRMILGVAAAAAFFIALLPQF